MNSQLLIFVMVGGAGGGSVLIGNAILYLLYTHGMGCSDGKIKRIY